MSAAATAAGYLYASGRLRGRGAKAEQEAQQPEKKPQAARERRPMRVAVYERYDARPEPQAEPREKPRRTPKIEYRVRRWRPQEEKP